VPAGSPARESPSRFIFSSFIGVSIPACSKIFPTGQALIVLSSVPLVLDDDRVVDVSALTRAAHESEGFQELQLMGHRRVGALQDHRNLAETDRPAGKQ
jgi:hypothetical protein